MSSLVDPANRFIVINYGNQIVFKPEVSNGRRVILCGEGIYWALVDLWLQKGHGK